MDLSNLYAGYARASSYTPVPRRTLRRALSPFNLKLSSAYGKSDTQLRNMAARKIVKRYLRQNNKSQMHFDDPINKLVGKTFKRSKPRFNDVTGKKGLLY